MFKKGSNWTKPEKDIVKKFCKMKKKGGYGNGAGKGVAHECQAALLKAGFNRSTGSVNNQARHYGGFTNKKIIILSDKEKKIIKKYDRYGDGGLKEAQKELKKAGYKRTWQSVQTWGYNNDLNIGNKWTKEELKWLKSKDLFNGTVEELCGKFLEKFPDCNRTACAVETKFNRLGYRLNFLWEPEQESEMEKLRGDKKHSIEKIQKTLADAKEKLEIGKIKQKRKDGLYDRSKHSIINKCYSLKIAFQVSNDWEYWTEEEFEILFALL